MTKLTPEDPDDMILTAIMFCRNQDPTNSCKGVKWQVTVTQDSDGKISPTESGPSVLCCPSCGYHGYFSRIDLLERAAQVLVEHGRVHTFPKLKALPSSTPRT